MSSTFTVAQLQAVLKRAAEIHETSWIKPTEDAPYSGHYDIDNMQACYQACKELDVPSTMARLLYLALDTWQNDILDWADDPTGLNPGPICEEEEKEQGR